MAAELVWLEQAESDLQSIYDYISIDNAAAAETYAESLISACERLRFFPLSGRAFNRKYRVLVMQNHLVLYRYERLVGEVIVAAIVDGRRDVAALINNLSEKGR
jgi:plasmid stabilization system protein ParE